MLSHHALAARRLKPFAPFSITTGSGESYVVSHPWKLTVHEPTGQLVFSPRRGVVALIDPRDIATVEPHDPPRAAARA